MLVHLDIELEGFCTSLSAEVKKSPSGVLLLPSRVLPSLAVGECTGQRNENKLLTPQPHCPCTRFLPVPFRVVPLPPLGMGACSWERGGFQRDLWLCLHSGEHQLPDLCLRALSCVGQPGLCCVKAAWPSPSREGGKCALPLPWQHRMP